MDKLKIIRPNGEEEIAELTTDKSLVGNNYLKLDIGGVPHYAKVGEVIETHAYTFNGVDGKKYYVKKEIGNVENPPSGDSPTLNIHGTLIFAESDEEILVATSDKINTTSAGYRVNNVYAQRVEDYFIVEIDIPGIEEFYRKPGIYTTSVISVKIGDVLFDVNREGANSLSGGSAGADFAKLKENVGKPLNFSIKYP